jgi:hypothetical protein
VGIKCTEGVVLIVDKRVATRLLEPSSIEKIFRDARAALIEDGCNEVLALQIDEVAEKVKRGDSLADPNDPASVARWIRRALPVARPTRP